MAELAVTDGLPPPADLPRGECNLTRLADGSVRIDHADPRLLISAELLDQIAGEPDPARAWLNLTGCAIPDDGLMKVNYEGAVLTLYGVNCTVIYRITEYLPRVNGYIAEWPD